MVRKLNGKILNVLDQIIEGVQEDLAERKKQVGLNELMVKISEVNPCPRFLYVKKYPVGLLIQKSPAITFRRSL